MKARGAQGHSKMSQKGKLEKPKINTKIAQLSKLDESKVTPKVSRAKTEGAQSHPKRCLQNQ
eukprot:73477-Karenia_brevis.AAC.1